jgi:hypothetical protein
MTDHWTAPEKARPREKTCGQQAHCKTPRESAFLHQLKLAAFLRLRKIHLLSFDQGHSLTNPRTATVGHPDRM